MFLWILLIFSNSAVASPTRLQLPNNAPPFKDPHIGVLNSYFPERDKREGSSLHVYKIGSPTPIKTYEFKNDLYFLAWETDCTHVYYRQDRTLFKRKWDLSSSPEKLFELPPSVVASEFGASGTGNMKLARMWIDKSSNTWRVSALSHPVEGSDTYRMEIYEFKSSWKKIAEGNTQGCFSDVFPDLCSEKELGKKAYDPKALFEFKSRWIDSYSPPKWLVDSVKQIPTKQRVLELSMGSDSKPFLEVNVQLSHYEDEDELDFTAPIIWVDPRSKARRELFATGSHNEEQIGVSRFGNLIYFNRMNDLRIVEASTGETLLEVKSKTSNWVCPFTR